jgi:hypothetical protein
MKKLMLTIGVFSFLMLGAVTIDNVNANSLFDDPPKKEVKAKSGCSDMVKTKCCSSKKTASKAECEDKEGKSASKTTSASTSTTAKKNDPDKK